MSCREKDGRVGGKKAVEWVGGGEERFVKEKGAEGERENERRRGREETEEKQRKCRRRINPKKEEMRSKTSFYPTQTHTMVTHTLLLMHPHTSRQAFVLTLVLARPPAVLCPPPPTSNPSPHIPRHVSPKEDAHHQQHLAPRPASSSSSPPGPFQIRVPPAPRHPCQLPAGRTERTPETAADRAPDAAWPSFPAPCLISTGTHSPS